MTAGMAGFIDSQRTDHGVPHAVSCRALGIAPSTFYKHRNRPVTARQLRRQVTDAEVKRAFEVSQGTYGSPRVRAQLRRDGLSVSKTTVEASMVRQGLCARPKRRYRGLTSQNPGAAAPSDLLGRDFTAQAINQKWCGDFKEVPTAEGKVFLATVEDLYSRRMLGFATSNDYPTAELAKQAINMALAARGGDIKGVIFHSDKGSQAGFNRSSQHPVVEVVCGSSSAGSRSSDSAEVGVARSSEVPAACRGCVLGRDREGCAARGGVRCCRCCSGRRRPVVPRCWRHGAVRHPQTALSPLPLFR